MRETTTFQFVDGFRDIHIDELLIIGKSAFCDSADIFSFQLVRNQYKIALANILVDPDGIIILNGVDKTVFCGIILLVVTVGNAILTGEEFAAGTHMHQQAQVGAIVKGCGMNLVDIAGNSQNLQRCAAIEGLGTNGTLTVAQLHIGQRSAVAESAAANMGDSFRQMGRLQTDTTLKRLILYGGQRAGEGDIRQAGTVLEGGKRQLGQAFRQGDGLDGLVVFKGRCSDLSNGQAIQRIGDGQLAFAALIAGNGKGAVRQLLAEVIACCEGRGHFLRGSGNGGFVCGRGGGVVRREHRLLGGG